MDGYVLAKTVHVLSSTVLLGTGAGIAFFMWRAHRTRDARVIAAVAADVVRADFLFTTTAVVLQPATGFLMLWELGYPWTAPWIRWSLLLYVLVGCCWLPVVWLQLRLRDMLGAKLAGRAVDEMRFQRYVRWWFALGWPAFVGLVAVFGLMVAKPA